MALEMKLGDVLITSAFLSLLITIFTSFFIAADTSIGTSSISTDLESIENTQSNNYEDIEKSLEQQVSNSTGFVVKENIFIDERGTGESDLSSKKSKSGFKNFVSAIFTSDKNGGLLDNSLKVYATSWLILVITILGLRAIFGNGRW